MNKKKEKKSQAMLQEASHCSYYVTFIVHTYSILLIVCSGSMLHTRLLGK